VTTLTIQDAEQSQLIDKLARALAEQNLRNEQLREVLSEALNVAVERNLESRLEKIPRLVRDATEISEATGDAEEAVAAAVARITAPHVERERRMREALGRCREAFVAMSGEKFFLVPKIDAALAPVPETPPRVTADPPVESLWGFNVWRCSQCGEMLTVENLSQWRSRGTTHWEHHCPSLPAQCGYFEARNFGPATPQTPKAAPRDETPRCPRCRVGYPTGPMPEQCLDCGADTAAPEAAPRAPEPALHEHRPAPVVPIRFCAVGGCSLIPLGGFAYCPGHTNPAAEQAARLRGDL
jgi:rubrerythrin